ncbi:MAG: tRNA 2-thiouridine(34) synthase MnmA [bacterium]|nr:tRNA 2-thiouridine(34) synthase MnmA [bacterium]
MAARVFVGLSGGVDSAVSAALLKNQGFNVEGVFIKIWQPEFTECTWAADRLDAMRVTVALGIPFREIDLSDDYKRMVVEDMIAAYKRGITPNPDVLCNRHIKFGSFLKYALREGANYIATGHYSRIKKSEIINQRDNAKSENGYTLLRGIDANKDQSYFLYTLGREDLARTLFPVGGLLKKQVRALAQKWKLPVAQKSDSQGLCFVGDVTMKDFLSHYIRLEGGSVLDRGGAVIGTHDGAALYTIGQRHGFVVKRSGGDTAPQYVVAVDIPANTITVSARREDAARKEVLIDTMHWVGKTPALPLQVQAQARYREKARSALISADGKNIKIVFDEQQIAAAGQSLVVYDEDVCLGGGVILN